MEKSNNSDKFVATALGTIFACLFTGGIAASVGFSIPITVILTAVVIFTLSYSANN